MRIADNLKRVNDNIAAAAARAGRSPGEVTLVVVTKTRTPDEIRETAEAGVQAFGENRVQEAVEKIPGLRDLEVTWHMVGHLQRNKVKKALELFDIIQSVDGLSLAGEINKRSSGPVPCLLEVNVSGEASKFGVAPAEVASLIKGINTLPNIELRGLMTVGPLTTDRDRIRRAFAELAELFEAVKPLAEAVKPLAEAVKPLAEAVKPLAEAVKPLAGPSFRELSMGMTDDYEIAIEKHATIIRLGRAIFVERPY